MFLFTATKDEWKVKCWIKSEKWKVYVLYILQIDGRVIPVFSSF